MDARLISDTRVDDDLAGELAAIGACHARLVAQGVDLSAFNLRENAADIPVVMAALGYGPFNLFATSAATLMAQHLLAEHPEGLRSVILDSPLPIDALPYADFVVGADHALVGRLDACSADTRCDTAFGNLKADFLTAIDQLNARPVTVTVRDPHTEGKVDIVLNGDRLAELVYDMLSDSQTVPVLPIFLQSISEHDYSLVPTFAPALFHPEDFSRGMQYSMLCGGEFNFSADRITRVGELPQFDRIVAAVWPERLFAGCGIWKVNRSPDNANSAVSSDIPTLVVSGQFDILPADYGTAVVANLTSGQAVTIRGAAHTPTGANNCSLDIVEGFVTDPSQRIEADCLAGIRVRFMTEPLARRVLVSEPPLGRLAVLVSTVLLLMSVPIAWVGSRRRRTEQEPNPEQRRRARRVLLTGAGLCLAFLGAFIVTNPLEALYHYSLVLRLAMLLPLLAIPFGLAALAFSGLAWRNRWWRPASRIHYTLATLGLLTFIWQLDYWHLLGVRLAG